MRSHLISRLHGSPQLFLRYCEHANGRSQLLQMCEVVSLLYGNQSHHCLVANQRIPTNSELRTQTIDL